MRAESWLLSDPDESQRAVLQQPIDSNLVVEGVAGSGKTNMAISRASQAKATKGSYILVVFNVALKRWISYGLKKLNLDKENVVYAWAWDNTGLELDGQVYCKKYTPEEKRNFLLQGKPHPWDDLYLVNDNNVRKFTFVKRDCAYPQMHPDDDVVGIHFDDYVDEIFYKAFGRRQSWFRETEMEGKFNLSDMELIPRALLYHKIVQPFDYVIIDEAQDMNAMVYLNKFLPMANKSLSLFGDSNPKLYKYGSPISVIKSTLKNAGVRLAENTLAFNYRLPKTVAKIAQTIFYPSLDLITSNRKNGGDSDYPTFPKPVITHCANKEAEMDTIINYIRNEDLDDVAILVPTDQDVIDVNKYLSSKGITCQVRYSAKIDNPSKASDENDQTFRRIDTYNFSNTDVPCILTYVSAKGTEFDNVFIPFAESSLLDGNVDRGYSFYVACTRSSYRLFLSYSMQLTGYLSRIGRNDVVWMENLQKKEEVKVHTDTIDDLPF